MGYIELIYKADVVVTVDLDEGTVTRVQVDDEGSTAPEPETDEERKALKIAEDRGAMWPAWEFGF